MTQQDAIRYEELLDQADQCRALAADALRAESPVGVREWMEAHDAARRAAHTLKYPSGESV
jgi:hypothetical protein